MKTKRFIALASLAVLLAGCVIQSIQPLFREKDFIPYPELVGTWTHREGEREYGRWTFTDATNHYRFEHVDDEGRKGKFIVIPGKLGTNVFLEFTLADTTTDESLNEYMAMHIIPAHVFAKVVRTNGDLRLTVMDYEWLDKHLQANPKALANLVQHNRRVLTATTEELQKFVMKFADDGRVFTNSITLVRKPGGR